MGGILHSSPIPTSQFILKSTSCGPSKPKRKSWIQRACHARREIFEASDNFPTSSTTSLLNRLFLTPNSKTSGFSQAIPRTPDHVVPILAPIGLLTPYLTWELFTPLFGSNSQPVLKRWLPLLHYPAFWHLIFMMRLIYSVWCVWFCIQPESYRNALLISTRVHKPMINSNSKIYSSASTSCLLYMCISFILDTKK